MIKEPPKEQVTLYTNRLKLRALMPKDIESIVKNYNDDVVNFMSNSTPYTKDKAVKIVEDALKNYKNFENIAFAITLKEKNILIGIITLDINKIDDHITIDYWIGKEWWGNGYMSETLTEIVRYCFRDLKTHRVTAHHFHTNMASGKVMQKAGLKLEGRRKEHFKKNDSFLDILDYGVVKDEWLL